MVSGSGWTGNGVGGAGGLGGIGNTLLLVRICSGAPGAPDSLGRKVRSISCEKDSPGSR